MTQITYDPFPIQSFYLFQTKESDPFRAFESLTQLQVNRSDLTVFPISTLEQVNKHPKQAQKSWWNSFWDDGWSHIAFGTVSTAFGIGFLCLATGPVGWITGVLALSGGAISVASGGGQLLTTDPETKKLLAQLGDASLSLNNIPGFTVGTATYILTGSYGQTIEYANYAGILAGGYSLASKGMNAIKLQQMYNLEVGSNSSRWSTRTRGINAMLMDINPKGLEGSHLVPQRVIKTLVAKAPKFRKPIENLANGPLGINFMSSVEHALVDPYRYRTLPVATKEILALTNPTRVKLLENYPKLAEVLGFIPNMSPTTRPVFNSLVITSGRSLKTAATSSSEK